jgi:protein-tyrosine kinase
MGKIAEALEKHKKEKTIRTEVLPIGEKRKPPVEETPAPIPRDLIPEMEYDPKLVVLSAPESVDAENFKVLRAQVLFPKDEPSPKTIMVTSAFPGEGKSFVSANLAISIALGINEHVLLVDCDLRRPSLHRALGFGPCLGLCEHLNGKEKLEDLIIRTKIPRLSLLPAGPVPPNPSELLSSRMMRSFLDEVRNRYDDRYIIIDATPSQVTAETNVLAQYVDGIIFVVMAGKSPRDTVKRSIENLGKKKILGVVFNGYEQSYRGYKKYYKKYYN